MFIWTTAYIHIEFIVHIREASVSDRSQTTAHIYSIGYTVTIQSSFKITSWVILQLEHFFNCAIPISSLWPKALRNIDEGTPLRIDYTESYESTNK